MTRTNYRTAAIALGLVTLVATSDAFAQRRRSRENRHRGCYTLNVSNPEDPAATTNRRSRATQAFSASEILDLEFLVQIPSSLAGNHEIEIKVFTPKGHLYQSFTAPFPPAGGAEEIERLERRGLRRTTPRTRDVTVTLPVAGTTIVTSSLYGAWRAEAYLDGDSKICTAPRNFKIEP